MAVVPVIVRATDEGDLDWKAPLSNIEAVAGSAARCFPVFEHDESIAIKLVNMPNGPMVVHDLSLPEGEAIVWLHTQETTWARIVYQFAHEFCHVIADPRTLWWDRFLWIEEAICETASLYALGCVTKAWAAAPPYPNWRDYAEQHRAYLVERLRQPAHCLPPGTGFQQWLAERLPLLQEDAGRREDNTIIAKALLPIFEGEPTAWQTVRYLHAWPRAPEATLNDFFEDWANACPGGRRHVPEAIGRLLS